MNEHDRHIESLLIEQECIEKEIEVITLKRQIRNASMDHVKVIKSLRKGVDGLLEAREALRLRNIDLKLRVDGLLKYNRVLRREQNELLEKIDDFEAGLENLAKAKDDILQAAEMERGLSADKSDMIKDLKAENEKLEVSTGCLREINGYWRGHWRQAKDNLASCQKLLLNACDERDKLRTGLGLPT